MKRHRGRDGIVEAGPLQLTPLTPDGTHPEEGNHCHQAGAEHDHQRGFSARHMDRLALVREEREQAEHRRGQPYARDPHQRVASPALLKFGIAGEELGLGQRQEPTSNRLLRGRGGDSHRVQGADARNE